MYLEVTLALFLVFLVFIFASKVHTVLVDDRIYVEAFDGRQYKVRNTKNKKETADTLAKINSKVATLLKKIQKEDDPQWRAMISRTMSRYNPEVFSEGKVDKRYTSYTVNKGEEVVLCLRSRDEKDELYDENLVFYVTLHELAHISSITEDHSDEFHANFKFLLDKAKEYGMFKRVRERINYCGMNLDGV